VTAPLGRLQQAARPPILRDLLSFDSYRQYFRTNPPMPANLLNNPWQVWGHKSDNSGWSSWCVKTYRDAYGIVKEWYNQTHIYDDLCIVSRTVLFKEPGEWKVIGHGKDAENHFFPKFKGLWDSNHYEWCMRCRRPTLFEYWHEPTHRALKAAPILTQDEPYRCYYCGARRSFAGDNNG
jgi:DNA-directed RNA polymerase subunit RPC12/RpoP